MLPAFIRKIFPVFSPALLLALCAVPVLFPAPTYADAANTTAPAAGFVPERSKKPKYAVIGYITAYLYNDLSAVGYFDAVITAAIEKQINVTAEGRKMTANDAEKRQIEIIRRNEHEKRKNSAYAPFEPQARSKRALPPLYKVLYPGMKYRIVSVRDVKPKARATAKLHCVKEVTVELMYPYTNCAPNHKGRRIKRGLVKVRLQKWNWPLEYKVCGYIPAIEGVEYFM